MITKESIQSYQGISLNRGSNFLYLSPHILLRPYIANYTISFPSPQTMPDEYTVLPTASSTLTISVGSDTIFSGLRGVNTKACNVGAFANKMKLLLLIEFQPGGLYPFIQIDQFELVDSSFKLDELDKTFTTTLENELIKSESVTDLVETLNRIFITKLMNFQTNKSVLAMMQDIVKQHGNKSTGKLSSEYYYSEKQIRRLFMRFVGTSPKMFSRIVRTNYALHLLQRDSVYLTDVAVQAGFFDQPHFIHDFRMVCGLTPQEYIHNMSVFYNDRFKM
ncbi:helix-turn-helix domain-containing protein [Anaerocolumna sedimenticola]|uniref:Helix-turn-helix domain-containing protein n=1 Tax=Anaerocolumna sedimenticola TaxID=2696063 RepID=A0A6P1TJ91_9FIRM|nr:helix-turn-helix domain-containing protein [Anaerocolumna sedimenticola]QHQ60111.1 helix-turn-helix domain-containing protein [Anaerocolumna sedimenticola]